MCCYWWIYRFLYMLYLGWISSEKYQSDCRGDGIPLKITHLSMFMKTLSTFIRMIKILPIQFMKNTNMKLIIKSVQLLFIFQKETKSLVLINKVI